MLADGDPFWFISGVSKKKRRRRGVTTARWRGPIALVPAVRRDKLDILFVWCWKLYEDPPDAFAGRNWGRGRWRNRSAICELSWLMQARWSRVPTVACKATKRWLHKPEIDITGSDWLKREGREAWTKAASQGLHALVMAGWTHVKQICLLIVLLIEDAKEAEEAISAAVRNSDLEIIW